MTKQNLLKFFGFIALVIVPLTIGFGVAIVHNKPGGVDDHLKVNVLQDKVLLCQQNAVTVKTNPEIAKLCEKAEEEYREVVREWLKKQISR